MMMSVFSFRLKSCNRSSVGVLCSKIAPLHGMNIIKASATRSGPRPRSYTKTTEPKSIVACGGYYFYGYRPNPTLLTNPGCRISTSGLAWVLRTLYLTWPSLPPRALVFVESGRHNQQPTTLTLLQHVRPNDSQSTLAPVLPW